MSSRLTKMFPTFPKARIHPLFIVNRDNFGALPIVLKPGNNWFMLFFHRFSFVL